MNILIVHSGQQDSSIGLAGLSVLGVANPTITIINACSTATGVGPSRTKEEILRPIELEATKIGTVSKIIHAEQSWADRVLEHAAASMPDLIVLSDDGASKELLPTTEDPDLVKVIENARCSVLLVRESIGLPESMRAVFATDHSPYCLRCIRSLLRLQPSGLKQIRIITALDDSQLQVDASSSVKVKTRPKLSERTLLELNRALIEHLESYGFRSDAQLIMGSPERAVELTVDRISPDLLSLASQGSGFSPEKGMGSLVKHEVLNHPGHILVLRP